MKEPPLPALIYSKKKRGSQNLRAKMGEKKLKGKTEK
jgi:hypothetical protein